MTTEKIIKELLDDNLIGAKKEIEEALYSKLGEHLQEMYKEVAPDLINEGKKKKKKKDDDEDEEKEEKEGIGKSSKWI